MIPGERQKLRELCERGELLALVRPSEAVLALLDDDAISTQRFGLRIEHKPKP